MKEEAANKVKAEKEKEEKRQQRKRKHDEKILLKNLKQPKSAVKPKKKEKMIQIHLLFIMNQQILLHHQAVKKIEKTTIENLKKKKIK
jgi:hypothetical protein